MSENAERPNVDRQLSDPFPHQVKVVVIGDGSVGKTCLLTVFVEKKFPSEYEPTIFNNLEYKINIDGKVGNSNRYNIFINDTDSSSIAKVNLINY